MTTINKQDKAANAMTNVISWLDDRGIDYKHLPPHQIKIGMLNFWPGKGTITVDGEDEKRPEKGLVGLEAILIAAGVKIESSGNAASKKKLVR